MKDIQRGVTARQVEKVTRTKSDHVLRLLHRETVPLGRGEPATTDLVFPRVLSLLLPG